MKTIKALTCAALILMLCVCMTVPAFADSTTDLIKSYDTIVNPIVQMINGLLKPLLAIVVAAGSLFCVILGVKYAKAEEPQDREKAKQHLKNAVIGFFLIFVLVLALNLLKQPLINWVNGTYGDIIIS